MLLAGAEGKALVLAEEAGTANTLATWITIASAADRAGVLPRVALCRPDRGAHAGLPLNGMMLAIRRPPERFMSTTLQAAMK
jgi:hypothetical protein